MRSGFRIGTILGLQIYIDWSWILIFLLVVWNLGGLVFPQMAPGWSLATAWITAVVAALVFFASVLAHEMAHSLVARRFQIPVRRITLFLFGGVASIEQEPRSPRAEFLITIVGPITSVVLGIIFVILGGISARVGQAQMFAPLGGLRPESPITVLLFWLGQVNIAVGIFNLIPGFPLDGGRVLRSILWAITGSLPRSTRWASSVGQAVGWIMIIAGVVTFFAGRGFVTGIWLAFIGWFLASAARQSYEQLVVHHILEGAPVSALMRRDPPTADSRMTIWDVVHDRVMGTDDHAFPVVEGDRLVGIICLHDIRRVPRDEWQSTRVADVMTGGDALVTVQPGDDSADALDLLSGKDLNQLPVVQDGALVGLLRRRDIMRWLQLHAQQARPWG